MFALLGFCCVFWLLISPGWRFRNLTTVTRQDGFQVPLLEDEARRGRQVNRWLVCWVAISLLAFIGWFWFFKSSEGYQKLSTAVDVPWLWPNEDLYLICVIYLGLSSNFVWLIWLGILDYKTTLLCSSIVATVSVVICLGWFAICDVKVISTGRFAICYVNSTSWIHMLGWSAITLAFIANIFRLASVEHSGFSWFALSVALAGTAPEILWMLNVYGESGTVSSEDGKTIGLWDIFFKRNCHWKVSWTLNSLLRLPELIILIRQFDRSQLYVPQLVLGFGRFFSSMSSWKDKALRCMRREYE